MLRQFQVISRGMLAAVLALLVQSQSVRAALTATGDVLPNPLVASTSVQIASNNNGAGFLTIDNGTSFVSNSVTIGTTSTSLGIATVTGAGSAWSTSGMDIGTNGFGRLEVSGGAYFEARSGSPQFRMGSSSNGSGTVIVQGAGTVMQLATTLTVGNSGEGLMQVGNGAIVNLPTSNTSIGAQGRIEMSGGLLRTNGLSNSGTLVGDGEFYIQGTSPVTNNGRINANSGDRLYLSGASTGTIQNNGEIGTEGGEIEFLRPVNNVFSSPNSAQISLRNGIVRFATAGTSTIGLTNTGVLASTGGDSDVYGRIENNTNGDIGVTNSSVLTFHHDVNSNGGTITVFPGSVAVFLQDLTVSGSGLILANIAGTDDDTGFGRVEVVGTATINGVVQASLAPGFTPQEGNTFQLLSAGSISGTPTLGTMPTLPNGLSWNLNVQANRVLLSVILPGDYNGDGHVDAADYTIWQDTLGSTTDLRADGNGNHKIDTPDFTFWKSHFNTGAGSGGGSAGAPQGVPEPSAFCIVITGLALAGGWPVRRRGKLS